MEKRLIELMEYYNLSSSQFADKIGVQRSSISHILSGRNKPSYDFLLKILDAFSNIDANWLINGQGTIEKSTNKQFLNVKEQDLFSQESIKSEKAKNIEKEEQIISASIDNKVIQNTTENIKNNQFTNVNSVKQIILIYENNTFEVVNKK